MLGLVSACFAGTKAPGYALGSNIIYRAEVGGVIFSLSYAIGVAAWLAWQGRALSVELGPLRADPSEAEGVDEAASGFDAFRDDVEQQIEDLRTAVDDLRRAIEG